MPHWHQAFPPAHYPLWNAYCGPVRKRPSVSVGRIIPEHGDGVLGILICSCGPDHDDAYTFGYKQWPRLLQLIAGAVPRLDHGWTPPVSGWLHFNGYILAAEIPADGAEALAAAAMNLIEELVQPPERRRF